MLLDATHNWSFLLTEAAQLLGINALVAGTGTFGDPWRVSLAAAAPVDLELVAWNAQSNPAAVQQLRLGLRLAAIVAPLQFSWSADLLAFDLPATGTGDVALLGYQHLAFAASPLPSVASASGIRAGADAFRAQMDWALTGSASWTADIDNLRIQIGSSSVSVPQLRFPIPGGLGIDFPWFSPECLGVDFLGFAQEVMWIVMA